MSRPVDSLDPHRDRRGRAGRANSRKDLVTGPIEVFVPYTIQGTALIEYSPARTAGSSFSSGLSRPGPPPRPAAGGPAESNPLTNLASSRWPTGRSLGRGRRAREALGNRMGWAPRWAQPIHFKSLHSHTLSELPPQPYAAMNEFAESVTMSNSVNA